MKDDNEHGETDEHDEVVKTKSETIHAVESIAHIGFSVQRSNPIYSISVLR